MTTVLIDENTFNTTLDVGAEVSGEFIDTSINTAVRLWINSNQNLSVKIIYADNSQGTGTLVSEQYSAYANNIAAINSTKKKSFAKVSVTNTGTSSASKVVVKTKHSIRDPNPVLTYMTDDITAQAHFVMDEFTVSFTNPVTVTADICTNVVVYGTSTPMAEGSKKALLTDASGRLHTISYPRDIVGPYSIYQNPTHVAADAQTSAMDLGAKGREINLMIKSTTPCTLKLRSSLDNITFYDTAYACVITTVNTNHLLTVPMPHRYGTLVPDVDVSMFLSYTY